MSADSTNIVVEMVNESGFISFAVRRSMVSVTDKVSQLLDGTFEGDEWRTYRLAYGVRLDDERARRYDDTRTPTQMQWAAHRIDALYDPTIQELFGCKTHTRDEPLRRAHTHPGVLHTPLPPQRRDLAAVVARSAVV